MNVPAIRPGEAMAANIAHRWRSARAADVPMILPLLLVEPLGHEHRLRADTRAIGIDPLSVPSVLGLGPPEQVSRSLGQVTRVQGAYQPGDVGVQHQPIESCRLWELEE